MSLTGILKRIEAWLYTVRTGYKDTPERANPDFPDENFQNHLKVYQFAAQFATSKDVLDVGCGTGYGTAHLAQTARSIVGIDISTDAIAWARKRYPQVKYLQMDAQHLEFPDKSFDFILSSENFEHLHDQSGHARELARVLRSDGLCVVGCPNPEMFVGIHNPYHTKENSLEELRLLFSETFEEVVVLENLLEPPTEDGRARREERIARGVRGDAIPAAVDQTWLHNTHSFVCFLKRPRSA